jgi:hypothetical protein
MFSLALLLSVAHAEDVMVSSNVVGASIFVNGVDTGAKTPATVITPRGNVQIAVQQGCERGEAVVDVPRGGTARVSVFAASQPGWLQVDLRPESAMLELDGRPFPGAQGFPVATTCGRHTVRAVQDGYLPAIVTIDVGAGREERAAISLTPLAVGALDARVTPRDAVIYLDGEAIGTDSVSLPTVYEGTHTLAAMRDGYQPAEKIVQIRGANQLTYRIVLERADEADRQSRISLVERSAVGPEALATTGAAAEPPAETEAPVVTEAPTRAAPPPVAPAAEIADDADGPHGRTLGFAALAGAAGAAGFTAWSWVSVDRAWTEYATRMENAGNARSIDAAERFYDLNVPSRRTRLWVSGGATAALAITGATLVWLDAPATPWHVVPTGDGMQVGWSRAF